MATTNPKKRLPSILKNNFWIDFMDSVSEELQRMKDEIQKKNLFYDVQSLTDKDELISIAKALGYTPDISLDDSLNNIKENVDSVPFRIKNKTTYLLYQYIFKTVPYPGEVFILYHEENKLIRAAISLLEMLGELGSSAQPYDEPFTYEAEENYSKFLFSELFLDTGLFLDSTIPWALDTLTSSSKTNHMAIEYVLEKVITRDGTDYLMLPDYFNYLFNAVDYTRKVTEIPHIGAQLSLIMDESGYFDAYTNESDGYSMPVLKTKAAVTDQYIPTDPATNAIRIIAGTGTQDLPSESDSSPSWPTELENQFAYYELVEVETEETSDYKIFNTMVQGNKIVGEKLGDGSDSVFSQTGSLGFPNVKPYSIRINFNASPDSYTIIDNGKGELYLEDTSDYKMGTIDYDTGEYDFATEKLEDQELEVLSQISVNSLNMSLEHENVQETTFYLRFKIGETGYIKQDDGTGGFTDTSTGISSGTLNYSDGTLDVTFQSSTEPRESDATKHGDEEGGVTCEYQFNREFDVDNGSEITVDYEVLGDFDITEAGVIDVNDNLIAYATFPPIRTNDSKYHASFQFIIKKGSF